MTLDAIGSSFQTLERYDRAVIFIDHSPVITHVETPNLYAETII